MNKEVLNFIATTVEEARENLLAIAAALTALAGLLTILHKILGEIRKSQKEDKPPGRKPPKKGKR